MTDKEKIRAEIERQIKKNNGSPISVCNDILSYIDSLSEEPVSEDLEEEMNRYLESNGMFIDTDNRKVKRYNGDSVDNIWDYEDIARYFVNWQKRQLEKNRLAACDKQTPEEAKREMDFTMSIIEKEHRQPTFDDAIKYGMKVQKELMMKDGVDATVHKLGNNYLKEMVADEISKALEPYNNGEKVKLIIIH